MYSELRQVLRGLVRNPGFSCVAILVVALGIGANTAVFSVANAMLIRPLPYADPGRMVMAWEKRGQEGARKYGASPGEYLDWRAQSRSFAALDAGNQQAFNLTGGGRPERVISSIVTSQLLGTYGVQPVVGRGFSEADEGGDGHVAVLSYRLWQRRFGAAPNAIGQTVRLNDEPYQIIGVLPRGFRTPYGKDPDLYVPWAWSGKHRQDRTSHRLLLIGRLRQGVSIAQAQAEMDAICGRLTLAYPAEIAGHGANLLRLSDEMTSLIRPPILVLLIAVAFLLLLACANTANLLLARATVREREIAIRQALGASAGQLIGLLLTESTALALAGGATGLLLAKVALALMPLRQDVAGVPPGVDSIAIDSHVLLFALALSVLTGVVFGLAPALQFGSVSQRLHSAARSYSAGVRGRWLRRALVIGEVAIAGMLLTGASLLIRGFLEMNRVNPGFQTAKRLSLEFALPLARYREPDRQSMFYDSALRRISALPSVQSAAISTLIPGDAYLPVAPFRIEGQPEPKTAENFPRASPWIVSQGFFSTMGVPVLRGRGFSSEDRLNSAKIILVSASVAGRYFGGSDPIGKRISLIDEAEWRTIVGIAGNIRRVGVELSEDPGDAVFVPLSQHPLSSPDIALIISSAQDSQSMAKSVIAEVAKIDADLPAGRVRTIEQVIEESVGLRRFQTTLATVFAGVALLLAAGGLYSVMAYLVTQRTREVGVRLALGAQRSDVLALVLWEGGLLGLGGIVLGLGGAMAAGRALKSLLVGVSFDDPLLYAGVALLLLAVALAASLVPALRATRLDPAVALRCE